MTRTQFGVVCGLLGVVALLQLLPMIAPARVAPRYEYRIEDVPDGELERTMDKHGDGGWDLVFARRAMGEGKTAAYEMIFRRPK